MADSDTVTELLIAQTERRLNRLREGIASEINRLGTELKLVDEALVRKKFRVRDEAPRPGAAAGNSGAGKGGKRFEGLPRSEVLTVVAAMGRPVRAAEVRDELMTKGVVRRAEAIRNALIRLERDGSLFRTAEGLFAVRSQNGDSVEVEAEAPVTRELGRRGSGNA